MTPFKFCGLKRIEDVEHAAELGAEFVGFVVLAPRSHRDLTPERAGALIAAAPPELETVLVTPETDKDVVEELVNKLRPDVVQLTGTRETALLDQVASRTGAQTWFAFTPSFDPDADQQVLEEAAGLADAIVLDAMKDGYGGTGDPVDWELARQLVDGLDGFPVVLAGGLTADNVGDAIRFVRPWAVDVSSGIETDQEKDPERMADFARAVEEAA